MRPEEIGLHGEPQFTAQESRTGWKNDTTSTADDKALVLSVVGELLQKMTPLIVVGLGLFAGGIGAWRDNTGLIDIAKIVTSGGIGAIAATRNAPGGRGSDTPHY